MRELFVGNGSKASKNEGGKCVLSWLREGAGLGQEISGNFYASAFPLFIIREYLLVLACIS